MSQLDRAELAQLFTQEIVTYIPEMQKNIEAISSNSSATTPLHELHRYFHNIKGTAPQVRLNLLSDCTRIVENYLEELIEKEEPVPVDFVETFRKTTYLISDFIKGEWQNSIEEEKLYKEIKSLFDKQKKIEIEEQPVEKEWQSSLRTTLPLLYELSECISSNPDDVEYNRLVLEKLSHAVSAVVGVITAAEKGSHFQLLHEFDKLFKKISLNSKDYFSELPELVGDFLQYIDVLFSWDSIVPASEPLIDEAVTLAESDYLTGDDRFDTNVESDFFDALDTEDEVVIEVGQEVEPAELFSATDDVDDLFQDSDQDPVELDEDQLMLLEIFRSECDDHLIVINQSLNSLERDVQETTPFTAEIRETVSSMRRAVHTLKGAAAMTGVNLLAKGGHVLEDMLDWLHDSADEITSEEVQIIATGVDVIELLAATPESTVSPDLDNLVKTITKYLGVQTGEGEVGDIDALPQHIEPEFTAEPKSDRTVATEVHEDAAPTLWETGTLRVKLGDLDELVSIEGELVIVRGSMEKMMDEFNDTLIELDNVKNNLRRKSQELEAGFEVQSLYGFNPAAPGMESAHVVGADLDDFDPIELDRYSQLNLIIRSLNEISVDVNSIHSTMNSLLSDISGQVGKQQLTMRLMQDKLMRIRMTPMSSISRVLFRTVRDTAHRLGKNVTLTVTGEDVYMDRFVWGKIIDPLMHILRNSVDHGIESKEQRQATGKPEVGRIELDAEQRSRYVLIRVSDDGGGINIDNIREKLRSENLDGNPDDLTDDELMGYIFQQSFSTKSDVSQISGRGVGLDVVKKNIQELRGTVQLKSTPGGGTTFEFQIPFTLSVNRAIMATVAGKKAALPLQDILYIRHFSIAEFDDHDSLTVLWNGEMVPVMNLGYFMQQEEAMTTLPKEGNGLLLVLFEKGDEKMAVSIDAIEEQREIVVKTLGNHLTHVQGISGVTVTGSGELIPILNLRELAEGKTGRTVTVVASAPLDLSLSEPLKVLIVDDSISVRHSVARLIESKSWVQQQAVDGLDALAKLETFTPDVIILDIEMPRMNGYELKSNLNNQEKFKDIPVVMLTSRVSEKHQQKAMELGVDHYLTKPYEDESFVALLESIRIQQRR